MQIAHTVGVRADTVAKMCPGQKEHVPIFETDKMLKKFKSKNSVVKKGSKMMGSLLESRNSVIFACESLARLAS